MRTDPLTFVTITAASIAPVPTWSRVIVPGFNPSTVMPGDWPGIPIGRWWVESIQSGADTYIDGVSTGAGANIVAPTPAQR